MNPKFFQSALALGTLLLSLSPSPAQAQGAPLWIEAEATASTNLKPNVAGWGRTALLSGGKWLHISIEEGQVAKDLPEGGGLLGYKFNLAQNGTQEIWNRIGFEFVRSPFEWRLDGGEWNTVKPDELTTDLMALQDWTEVAWLKLGERELSAGQHTLDIRLPQNKNSKDQLQRVLYASDALVIAPRGTFVPDGPNQPGTGQSARDEAAAKTVFVLPESQNGARSSVQLKGDWQVARNDEQTPPFNVAQPMTDFPARPNWKAIAVPSNKNDARPDLLMAHRLWYRTKVNVPASLLGRSFFLDFPLNSLNTTVVVNGVQCGFNKNPFARFQIDVSKAVKVGDNEIQVGIRDAYYGLSTSPKDPMKLRRKFNTPIGALNGGWGEFAYPVWNEFQSGILNTPTFVAAGTVYASDVFVKPNVQSKQLNAEITLSNPSNEAQTGEIVWQAIDDKSGAVAKTFAPQTFLVAAQSETTLQLSDSWTDAKLWWPQPDPQLYRLRATLQVGGQAVDVSDTRFGFRQWSIEGKDFKINGVKWHGWADTHNHSSREEWLRFYRQTNQKFMRLWKSGDWMGLSPDDALSWFDQNGVAVRRSGVMDGQTLGMHPGEPDADLRELYKTQFPQYRGDIKLDLAQNWRDQMLAQVRGERNHPSIHVWSIENEWLYIAAMNTGMADAWEPVITDVSRAVSALDPTRGNMVDGGGATKANTLPIHGDHYVGQPGDTGYPARAYLDNTDYASRGRWEWDRKRPRYIGEDLFAAGHNPAYSLWGGEAVFLGQQATRPAVGRFVNIATQGYRWAEFGAWHFWQRQDVGQGQYKSNAPLAVFCKQWNFSFGSGQKVARDFGIFNDTFFEREPIEFSRTLQIGGKEIWSKTTKHTVLPGENLKWQEILPMPVVAGRQEGTLALELKVGGKTVFSDEKAVTLLNPLSRLTSSSPAAPKNVPTAPKPKSTTKPKPARRAALWVQTRALAQVRPTKTAGVLTGIAALNARTLAVYDPQNRLTSWLKSAKISFSSVANLEALPATAKVLLVGPDALDTSASTSSALAAWASGGKRVIVLEQKLPLRFGALPADIESATNSGSTAFIEDATHPILRDLKDADFFTWGDNGAVYRNAYFKPTRGAKSLVQAHELLKHSPLVEVPVGEGVMVLCQLEVGGNLADEAVAQQLLVNLLDYCANYKQEFRAVVAVVNDAPQLGKSLDAIGLQYVKASDPLAALDLTKGKIAIISASPANLKVLAQNTAKVAAFNAGGGTVVLHGLTPEGLSDYNKVVGYNHLIRPMRRERVSFPPVKNPLTAGLSLSDVALYSSERIFPWQEGNYVASDTFSFIVDYEDVAPFGTFNNPFYTNIVTGMNNADGWKYIVNHPKTDNEYVLTLPRAETIREFTWDGNLNYNPTTKVELLFDGKDAASFDTQPGEDAQTFSVPEKTGRVITIRHAQFADLPGKNGLIGADNIVLLAKRPADFYQKVRPMLSIGGLMFYPRGKGGLVLSNLLFKETEEQPTNAARKRNVLATILRNLKAPFAGNKTIIAGALSYQTIDISSKANGYRTERGWFGDGNFTLKDLPTGNQRLAGVDFLIYEFPTSPVPTAIMLGGQNVSGNLPERVEGIPLKTKADALFFLHTARLDARRNNDEVRDNRKFEMARYVVHYADGQSVDVPIFAEINIEDFRQKTPQSLPSAQLAWSKPFANSDQSASAFSMQWNNPRPDVEIARVDLTYGNDRRGVPVLLAITAAKVR